MKTLILGIGNTLLGDEGIGVHVVHEIGRRSLPPQVSWLDGGTGGLHLLGAMRGVDRVVLVDATIDGAARSWTSNPGRSRVRSRFAGTGTHRCCSAPTIRSGSISPATSCFVRTMGV